MEEKLYFNKFTFSCEKKAQRLERTEDKSGFIIDGVRLTVEDMSNELIESKGDLDGEFFDIHKRRVFTFGEKLPIFDSGDAAYGSMKVLYITVENGYLTAITITSGYYYGSIFRYENIRFFDDETRERMNELGLYDDLERTGEYSPPKYKENFVPPSVSAGSEEK